MTRDDGRRRRARGERATRVALGTAAIAARARRAAAAPGPVVFNATTLQTAVDACATANPTFATCVDANNVGISNWNVAQVNDMRQLFKDKQSFNADISAWNVGQVTDMFNMFSNAISFNQSIGTWDVSSVTRMQQMFNNATVFNQDISSWTVAQVQNMAYMFQNAKAFNRNITNWSNYTGSGSAVYAQMFLRRHGVERGVGSTRRLAELRRTRERVEGRRHVHPTATTTEPTAAESAATTEPTAAESAAGGRAHVRPRHHDGRRSAVHVFRLQILPAT